MNYSIEWDCAFVAQVESRYSAYQGIQPFVLSKFIVLVCCTSVSGLTVSVAPNTPPPAHGKNTKVAQPMLFGKSVGHRNWFRSEMFHRNISERNQLRCPTDLPKSIG